MADEQLNITINVDEKNSTKSVDALAGAFKKLENQAKETATALKKGSDTTQKGLGKTKSVMSSLTSGFGQIASGAGKAFGLIGGGISILLKGFTTLAKTGIGLVTGSLKALGIVGATALGAVFAGIQALKPAGFLQTAEKELKAFTGSTEKATEIMGFLFKFARTTPFELKELVEGAKTLTAFGLFTEKTFATVAKAAKVAKTDVSAFSKVFGFIQSGRSGEAFERLARIGISRKNLTQEFGIEFSRGGELKSDADKTIKAILASVEKRFGTIFKELEGTFDQSLSNLGDAWFEFWAKAGKGLLPPVTDAINEISNFIGELQGDIEKLDFSDLGENIFAGTKALISQLQKLRTPEGRAELKEGLKESVKGLFDAGVKIGSEIFGVLFRFGSSLPDIVAIATAPFLKALGGVLDGSGNQLVAKLKNALPGLSSVQSLGFRRKSETLGSITNDKSRGLRNKLGLVNSNFQSIIDDLVGGKLTTNLVTQAEFAKIQSEVGLATPVINQDVPTIAGVLENLDLSGAFERSRKALGEASDTGVIKDIKDVFVQTKLDREKEKNEKEVIDLTEFVANIKTANEEAMGIQKQVRDQLITLNTETLNFEELEYVPTGSK